MINCQENKNDDGKLDYVNKVSINQNVGIETNVQSMKCLDRTILLCNQISNTSPTFEDQFIKKLS